MNKVKVNAPEYSKYHGKEMFVQWTKEYINSIGEKCTFYHLTLEEIQNVMFADIYLGQKQIIKNETVQIHS